MDEHDSSTRNQDSRTRRLPPNQDRFNISHVPLYEATLLGCRLFTAMKQQ